MPTSSRPDRLAVVTGTATEVGKTWVTAAVARVLGERGVPMAARKPAQSFSTGDATTDADVLAAATGETSDAVCPPHRRYAVPMAPPMAADVLGLPRFSVVDLAAETVWPDGVEVGLVETAGGVRSPQAADGDAVALCRAIDPDLVVLVGDAGLGTINDVRLSTEALDDLGVPILVVLNRYDDGDDLHRRNRAWLDDEDGLEVVVSMDDLADRLVAPVRRRVATADEARLLRHTIDLAVRSAGTTGGPFGAIVVRDGEVVGEGTNLVTATNDPTAHAEVTAIRRACERLGTFDLAGCELYSSCEPCPLCYAAALWSRLARVVHAATRQDATAAGFDDSEFFTQIVLPPEQRRVPVVHLRVEAAHAPFDAWAANPNRVPY